ncbi:hypothetical protein CJ20_122 [Escherichia phage CJ20]|nr:hypothetical protein CJ20_122 [Escherichia phage CJ20]
MLISRYAWACFRKDNFTEIFTCIKVSSHKHSIFLKGLSPRLRLDIKFIKNYIKDCFQVFRFCFVTQDMTNPSFNQRLAINTIPARMSP